MVTPAAPSSRGAPRDYDWVLSLFALAAALVSGLLLTARVQGPVRQERPGLGQVAALAFRVSEVRRRPAGSLVWDRLEAGQPLFEQDTVFVPPGSAATVALLDGARLELDENTLIVLGKPLERPGAAPRVALEQGALVGLAGPTGLEVSATGAVAALSPSAEARLGVGTNGGVASAEVAMLGGSAVLRTGEDVRHLEGDRARAVAQAGKVVLSPPPAARLLSPSPRHRQAPGEVTLRWEVLGADAARVQVATDSGFGGLHAQAPVAAGTLTLPRVEPGLYWWRVVDAAGQPRSETRRFTVAAPLAPVPLSPGPRERLDLPVVSFSWSAVAGAARYELEVLPPEDGPPPVATTAAAGGTSLRWQTGLGDGRYRWRVRAVLDGEPGPWSPPSPFRLVLRPLPDAPVLIDPTLEVEP